MSRYTFPREFYIPKGARKVADKASDAVAYIYNAKNGDPAACVFYGKQSKPIWRYRFKTNERREKSIAEAFVSRKATLDLKAKYRAERNAYKNDYEVGEMLVTCWGYDQTNVEWYEVVKSKGAYVWLREVKTTGYTTGWMTGKSAPLAGEYKGPELRRKAQKEGVRICKVVTARRAEAKIVAGVKTYEGRNWTAYA